MAFSPDGLSIAYGGQGGFLGLVRWRNGRPQTSGREFAGGYVYGVAFAPDGRHLVVSATSRFVRQLDCDNLERESEPLKGPNPGAGPIVLAPDGRTLAAMVGQGMLAIWDLPSGVRRAVQMPGCSESFAFAPDSRHLAVGNRNGTVYVLRLAGPR
jgi:WD40 repeat protein